MAIAERLFNIGYVGFGVETTPGTAVKPTDFGQAYDFGIKTMRNFEELAPAAGNVYSTQTVIPGLRSHVGDATFVFEPNTAEKLVAAMLAQSSRTGAGPYTSIYVPAAGNPVGKTYTIEVSDGVTAQRYTGCQVSKLVGAFSNNEVQLKPSISALGSFNARAITSVVGTTPYVINLDTTSYDPNPALGVVVGDIMTLFQVAASTTISFTVSAVSGTSISTTTNVGAGVAGDIVRLAALTPAFTMLPPVLWSNTQFCFGATAAAALSATQVRVDQGSTWELNFDFKDANGEHRSGDQDPATLLRKPAKANLTIKQYFRNDTEIANYNQLNKTACVVRHYVYSGANTYEFRLTLNHIKTNDPLPMYKAGEINYSTIKYIAQYDTTDGQAFAVTVINNNVALT
jgi:hypothetical protein